jgi:hypothetical protein
LVAEDYASPEADVGSGEAAMSAKSLVVIFALSMFAASTVATAQNAPPVGDQIVPAPSRVRAPIEIHPGARPLLYRRCTDWYELQHRPSGTVLYPGKHCWWVRG